MQSLYFDIETICDQRPGAQENARDLVKVPANYRKPEAIEKYRADHAEDAYRKTSLQGIAGEIVSIAWAIDDMPVTGLLRIKGGMSESELLETFFELITYNFQSPRYQWIGHNVIGFDLRFLKQRCLVNNVRPPITIPADAKHGGDMVFDTMKEWCGWKDYVSQDALCKAFGIDGKDGMDGSMVWDEYQAGNYDGILEYNKDDVRIVRELHKRMLWKC